MPRYRGYSQYVLSRLIIFLRCTVLCLGSWPLHSQAAPYPEDAVKAIFLYRFASYVTWPPAARATPHFTIAVAGDDHVADELAEFLPKHPVGDQPALVRRITGPSEVDDAQIAAAAVSPEFILLDIGMPGLSGYQVAGRLRKSGVRSVLIAITGWGQQSDRAQAKEAGFDHHMTKPIDPAALEKFLDEFPGGANLPLAPR